MCDDVPPPVQHLVDGHRIACHIPAEELTRLQTDAAPVAGR